MTTVAFLGLGQMGSPMANNLLQKGHALRVFDVNQQAVNELVQKGATAAHYHYAAKWRHRSASSAG